MVDESLDILKFFMDELITKVNAVISEANQEQTNKFFGSNVIKILNNHLPSTLTSKLDKNQQEKLQQLSSFNLFRPFSKNLKTAANELIIEIKNRKI